MANRSAIYKEILKNYDAVQTEAAAKRNQRRLELYERFPRIEEIDNTLSMLGIEVTKAVLSSPQNAAKALEELKEKQKKLKEEKEDILSNNKLPLDFLEIQHNCKKCKDTGYISNERCSCFNQKIVDSVYNKSNIKQIIKDENFENFSMDFYSPTIAEGGIISPRENMQRILSHCLSFTRNFEKRKENLFIYGKTGLGKTFICNCMAKELLDRGVTVMYVTAPQLFMQIEKERFNKDEEDESREGYLEDVLSVELLIIDDLGTEFDTIFTTSQLFNIINTRVINNLPMIISTNMEIKDLSEKYSDRITSRLMGDFTTLKFIGDDIRAIKKFKRS